MSSLGGVAGATDGLLRALDQLQSLGSLLILVDPARWDSVARPSAQAIGGLILSATSALRDELGELVDLPPP